MATTVSHAMRRISPASPGDTKYSSFNFLKSDDSSSPSWSSDEGGSALSRSMRYAEPWLYGSVRTAPATLLLAYPAPTAMTPPTPPAVFLCSCPDYANGTKRSSKKGPTTCKRCKGTRLPFGQNGTKYGTVRAYPTTPAHHQQQRFGTVRVSSSARPTILPNGAADPYDLMRRSRLASATELPQAHYRAKSISPGRLRAAEQRRRARSPSPETYAVGTRRSILECSVNPYELMSCDEQDISITEIGGRRVRVRPSDADYEDVDGVVLRTPHIPKVQPKKLQQQQQHQQQQQQLPASRKLLVESEKENPANNRFKSILKKPTTTFSDTDSSGPEPRSPSPARKSGSHFYLPLPNGAPRKKVQFRVEDDAKAAQLQQPEKEQDQQLQQPQEEESPDGPLNAVQPKKEVDEEKTLEETNFEPCRLRRSFSERHLHEAQSVVFHDSMALRTRQVRGDARGAFSSVTDLERLDGVGQRNRKISPPRPRPREPPPPPPPPSAEPRPEEAPPAEEPPPAAPPRKRSNSKQPQMPKAEDAKAESDATTLAPGAGEPPAKTIVQISPYTVHRLQIRNEYHENINVQTVSISDNTQRKTSILINGDDCYCTVNVSDDVPIYQSSVVVSDKADYRKSSVYITGEATTTTDDSPKTTLVFVENTKQEGDDSEDYAKQHPRKNGIVQKRDPEAKPAAKPATKKKDDGYETVKVDREEKKIREESEELKRILKDPVEAVKRNLVPHVCGKSDGSRRPRDKKVIASNSLVTRLLEDPLLESLAEGLETNLVAKLIEDSLLKLRSQETAHEDDKDEYSDNGSCAPYETMDPGSDCYSNNSNRSSLTEEEMGTRNKFYQLLADSALSEIDDHHYESIRANVDPIYEEIEIPPPLPSNPPPPAVVDDLQLDKQFMTRSIFEGASKYDILSYLVDAKERGIVPEESYTYNFGNSADVVVEEDETKEDPGVYSSRISHMSTVSDSSEDSSLVMTTTDAGNKNGQRSAEVERNDSGVGSETSKSSRSRYRSQPEPSTSCEDCEGQVESESEDSSLVCRKCSKKRCEKKEIITEIVETEEKYSRDLQIILEEFYQPMLVAGLLTPDQLSAIFLNVEELLDNSQVLAERLRDTLEIAVEQGDEDLSTVNIGKIFLEAAPMLHAFESYCVRQGAASLLLAGLEKEKELLRIFLRVSQMENAVLRRMNLNSFLMVPVQRVTKYPLLLSRLYKVTPPQHESRELLKEAQHKIELHLNHMNSETRDVPSKLWRRISSGSGRRSSAEMDLVNIKLRKIAVDVLEWNHDEARFALEGRLLYTQPTDNNWRKGRTIKLAPVNALLVTNGKAGTTYRPERVEEGGLAFPRQPGVREAALLLVRDKGGRYSLLRDPLYLDRCVVAADPAWHSYFEVQELFGKDTFIFKAEDAELTRTWYRQLQYHAQGMGAWRKRRNALANIMITGMGSRS